MLDAPGRIDQEQFEELYLGQRFSQRQLGFRAL